ncbi:MAG TPA: DMT family transporter [Verrucomicrobiae bacterium]|nr:DMT family transporter [Verrucomicrobiae bacterium]
MANRPTPLAASGRDYALLLLLSAMWGGSFLLIKLAVATLPPLWVASLRITVGGLALLLVLRLRRLALPRGRAVWARLAFMGILGNLAPFALIGWGELQVASGLAAILMAMVPLMVMVIAHFRVPDEPLTPGKTLGVGLGILCVIVLIGPSALSGVGSHVAAELAILAATACYAASALAARGLPPLRADAMSAGMLLVAAPVGLIAAALVDSPASLAPSLESLLAAVLLGLFCTGLGYVLFFRILTSAGAGFASMNNFLVPPFGVIYGWMVLSEYLPASAFAALALILLGLLALRWRPGNRLARHDAGRAGGE